VDRLTSTDASTISASAERASAEMVRRLCADYDFAMRELARRWNRICLLERHLTAYRAWIAPFVEVCPEPEDEGSSRRLVERLMGR